MICIEQQIVSGSDTIPLDKLFIKQYMQVTTLLFSCGSTRNTVIGSLSSGLLAEDDRAEPPSTPGVRPESKRKPLLWQTSKILELLVTVALPSLLWPLYHLENYNLTQPSVHQQIVLLVCLPELLTIFSSKSKFTCGHMLSQSRHVSND